jgi:hypothetical protein
MLKNQRRLFLLAVLMSPFCLSISGCVFSDAIKQSFTDSSHTKPGIMLWAWEAPSDLRFIDPKQIGVAFLAETITLRRDEIWTKPRLQPLKITPETFLTPVIRIESSTKEKPTLSSAQLDRVVASVIKKSKLPGVRAVQIDFDARVSEREFYRSLLKRLRTELPPNIDLSMTALASWCIGDRWLRETSADEIVPMFFSMGADSKQVANHLSAGREVDDFSKQKAIGLAENSLEFIQLISDSSKKDLLNGRRLYLFSARAWTKDSVDRLLRRVGTI